jgi:hypothetical protein
MHQSATFLRRFTQGHALAQRRFVVPALATLALTTLLTLFVYVLRGAVAQGEQRWREEAVDADSLWRCKALRGVADRTDCLAARQAERHAH